MRRFLIHYEPNGFIRNCVYEPSDEYLEMCVERDMVYAVFDGAPPENIHSNYYFCDGQVLPRPVIESLTNLPKPCIVEIDGECYTVGDGSLEFEEGSPGRYVVKIDQWPYMLFESEIAVE